MSWTHQFLTVKEAAFFLRLSVPTIYGLVHQRRLRHRKHGGRVVFLRADLETWSKSNEISALDRSPVDSRYVKSSVRRKTAPSSLKTEYDSPESLTSSKEVNANGD